MVGHPRPYPELFKNQDLDPTEIPGYGAVFFFTWRRYESVRGVELGNGGLGRAQALEPQV